jgi:hypothetical protein
MAVASSDLSFQFSSVSDTIPRCKIRYTAEAFRQLIYEANRKLNLGISNLHSFQALNKCAGYS